MDGCTEPFADSLLKRAGLDSVMEYAVKKLLKLRLHQAHDVASATASSNKQSHIYAKNKGILKRNKERAKKAPIRISRFVPTLGQVIEDVENNMVDEEAYPNVCPARNSVAASGRTAYASASVRGRASGRGGEGRRGGSLSPGRSAFKSLGTAANWGGWDSPRGIGGRYYHHQGGGSSKDTLIVCVLGGITLPEIRQGFDISSQLGIDVIIGGSVVLTAKRLVEALVSGPDNNNDNEMVMATGSV
ncbi:hypothetical protein Pmar_PMAR018748 [Perkinsus marinus ATCC 50983]|uniref:Uncharacterized protein n=1 Tax=Perkinsus marinus (strain ATCC 50983 / TXsc) TaxID=423536 RepID=C5KJ94_PERM5|nr:hypothetical protein Pmar_PMAR018748 [Perkinsus marinus ATCC 50983]EER15396.1 hypothetical protein Pmar_PMAR018748 [Perkinsus marinus ATCC 50983]|eukprot:XP_002783600.1 hypothetical protein Pmar_PMAR018748 [Perkinsus marinus ATCC 50983]